MAVPIRNASSAQVIAGLEDVIYRFSPSIFDENCYRIGPSLAQENTRFPSPFRPEKRIADFLMCCGAANCEPTASHPGMGRRTVIGSEHEVYWQICDTYRTEVRFLKSEEEVTQAMGDFKKLAGLPY